MKQKYINVIGYLIASIAFLGLAYMTYGLRHHHSISYGVMTRDGAEETGPIYHDGSENIGYAIWMLFLSVCCFMGFIKELSKGKKII